MAFNISNMTYNETEILLDDFGLPVLYGLGQLCLMAMINYFFTHVAYSTNRDVFRGVAFSFTFIHLLLAHWLQVPFYVFGTYIYTAGYCFILRLARTNRQIRLKKSEYMLGLIRAYVFICMLIFGHRQVFDPSVIILFVMSAKMLILINQDYEVPVLDMFTYLAYSPWIPYSTFRAARRMKLYEFYSTVSENLQALFGLAVVYVATTQILAPHDLENVELLPQYSAFYLIKYAFAGAFAKCTNLYVLSYFAAAALIFGPMNILFHICQSELALRLINAFYAVYYPVEFALNRWLHKRHHHRMWALFIIIGNGYCYYTDQLLYATLYLAFIFSFFTQGLALGMIERTTSFCVFRCGYMTCSHNYDHEQSFFNVVKVAIFFTNFIRKAVVIQPPSDVPFAIALTCRFIAFDVLLFLTLVYIKMLQAKELRLNIRMDLQTSILKDKFLGFLGGFFH